MKQAKSRRAQHAQPLGVDAPWRPSQPCYNLGRHDQIDLL